MPGPEKRRCSQLQRRILQCVADLEAEYGEKPLRDIVVTRFFGLRGRSGRVYHPHLYISPWNCDNREEFLSFVRDGKMALARTHSEQVSFNRSIQNLISKGWIVEARVKRLYAGGLVPERRLRVTEEGRLIVAENAH